MPASDKSDWQMEKDKQKITTTKRGHSCSRSAFGKVRFLGHYFLFLHISQSITFYTHSKAKLKMNKKKNGLKKLSNLW